MDGLKRGIIWSGISQVGQTGLQLISTIVLARLLTPADFGIMAIVAIFIAIGNMMVDSGMGSALLKKNNPDSIDFSTLFIYNFTISLLFYFLFFIYAPFIADFYQKPILIEIIRVLMLVIIIQAVTVTQYIILLRDLRFKAIALIIGASSFISFLVALLLALMNYGIWALVFQQISYACFYSILLWIVVRFRPKMTFSIKSFREQFTFGISLLSANLLSSITDNVNNNVIAKVVAIGQTGNFSQANRLVLSIDGGIKGVLDKVIFPVFAKIENIYEMKLQYIELTKKVISIVFPIAALLSLFSDQIIFLILGNQWKDASWMFTILSFVLIPMILQTLSRNILKSIGYTRKVFFNEIIKSMSILSILFTSSFFGLKYIIWGILLSHTIACFGVLILLSNSLHFSIISHFKLILSYIITTLISYFIALFVFKYFSISNYYLHILIVFLVFVFSLLVISKLFNQKELIRILFKKFK